MIQTKNVWCVMASDGLWCATKNNKKPDLEAISDETECDHWISLRVGSDKCVPTCPECLKKLEEK
jgi:hypothetical protein